MVVHASAMASHSQFSVGAGSRVVLSSRPQYRKFPSASGISAVLSGKEVMGAELVHLTDGGVQLSERPSRCVCFRSTCNAAENPTDEYTCGFHVSVNESKVGEREGGKSSRKVRDWSTTMKRTRSKANDERGPTKRRPAATTKAKRGSQGEIRSPTARTLLRMLRVGTGEATANDTNKQDAEAAILRLAGEYAPTEILVKRYAGREALQVLLTRYLKKPVTFEEASQCFHNPHNRGLEATQVFLDLLGDKTWPPFPENVDVSSGKQDLEGETSASDSEHDKNESRDTETSERRRRKSAAKIVSEFREVITTGVSPVQAQAMLASTQPTSIDTAKPFKQQRVASSADVFRIVDEFRPTITTGLSKVGTAFHMDSELATYSRNSGARRALLELRSFQLLTHHLTAPAALVTIKRQPSGVPWSSGRPPVGDPSLTKLRCADFLGAPRSVGVGNAFRSNSETPFTREALALSSELADLGLS